MLVSDRAGREWQLEREISIRDVKVKKKKK